MKTKTILKPIGNGQITIPQEWRVLLGIDMQHVNAEFKGDRIEIRPIETKIGWDISKVSFNVLKDENVVLIEEGEKSYKEGNFEDFSNHNDFWKSV